MGEVNPQETATEHLNRLVDAQITQRRKQMFPDFNPATDPNPEDTLQWMEQEARKSLEAERQTTEQHFEHLPCGCSQCAPFTELVASDSHEFHLLDALTVYCICGWVAKVPITATLRRAEEEPYDTISDLIDFWRIHIEEAT